MVTPRDPDQDADMPRVEQVHGSDTERVPRRFEMTLWVDAYEIEDIVSALYEFGREVEQGKRNAVGGGRRRSYVLDIKDREAEQ